jgi:hypothetical protein
MKNQLTKLVCSLVAITFVPVLSYATVTTLNPDNPGDCAKFNDNNTVIAAYKTGDNLESTLNNISNNPKYSAVSFYKIIVDGKNQEICGKTGFHDAMIFSRNSEGEEKIFKMTDGNIRNRLATLKARPNSTPPATHLYAATNTSSWFDDDNDDDDIRDGVKLAVSAIILGFLGVNS